MRDIAWGWLWMAPWVLVLLSAAATMVPNRRRQSTRVGRLVLLHTGLLWLPVLASLAGLLFAPAPVVWGPWRLDRLGFGLSLYIALLSLMIQAFSVRYLHGDRAYARYFAGLTGVTAAAAATWMSGNLVLFACGWAAMGFFLVWLIASKREWAPVRAVVSLSAACFATSALSVAAAVVWLALATGSWNRMTAIHHAATLSPEVRLGISLLLVLAALIQAGGWPFQRWLMESAVTPTPVSAVMHAGLVNAGGLLLTRMAPVFDGSGLAGHLVLLGFAWLSVAIGTGAMLVHADYKRQLVASTMAQMGLMLVQCALGVYSAAVVHLVLHGLFKATLFMRSGSVVPRPDQPRLTASVHPPRAGRAVSAVGMVALAVILGAAYWAWQPGSPTRALSGLFLGAGIALAWRQLAAVRAGRWLGLAGVAGAVMVAEWVRAHLDIWVQTALPAAHTNLGTSATLAVTVMAFVLFAGTALAFAVAHTRPTARAAMRLYLWLAALGEARGAAVEPHPQYLADYAKEAVLK
ncbi:MAG: NADH dehydrogenase subunit 5 [Alicyclobacillus sp.]|nr:NADH dehydrogenase subunit 5 [Alicyclobacillus sp.]